MKKRQSKSFKTSNLKPLTSPMNYVFFGTPHFATIILEKMIDANMPPSILICNPDRPAGRKKIITPPPTKELVMQKSPDTKIFQPENKNELTSLAKEIFENAKVGVVAAYAHILPSRVIDKALGGIVGVHPSLLPKLRGPSPIQGAILEGDTEGGITLYLLDTKVDHGPIIRQEKHSISKIDTYLTLHDTLANLAGELLIKTLPNLDKLEAQPQKESEATFTKKFISEDGYISPKDLKKAQSGHKKVAQKVFRKIRALNPEPGVYTIQDNVRTKLLKARVDNGKLVLEIVQKEGGLPVLSVPR